MVAQNDDASLESRPPTVDDLANLCRRLNEAGAKYIVIGGMAVIQSGFVRTTEDIDLLVDTSQENQNKIRSAMMYLSDQAIRDIQPEDLDTYQVLRIADEFIVDLMKSAGGVGYDEAKDDVTTVSIDGVPIPFASPQLLFKLKNTLREKDKLDYLFLKELLQNELALPQPLS